MLPGFKGYPSCYVILLSLLFVVSARPSNEAFIEVNEIHFQLDNQPFHFIGTNCYYLMAYAADPYLKKFADEVIEDAAAMGIKVIRMWAFNDGAEQWNALQTEPGNYQEYVFCGLDYILAKADEFDLCLILTIVNNWDDYGGMNQYVEWSSTAFSHDDFYTDTNTKQWYREHIFALLNRENTVNGRVYKDDPTIFAWELANEPRCSADASGSVLNSWIAEMSAYIKSLDSNHLVCIGCEGFYNNGNPINWMNNQGTDFIADHQVSTIDFAVAHSWPDHWGWSANKSATMSFLQQQISDAHQVIGKPFILEEFGKYRDTNPSIPNPPISTAGSGHTAIRDDFYESYYDLIYNNSAGAAFHWILYHDEYPDYDGFGVYYTADQSTVSIIENAVNDINSLNDPIGIGIATFNAQVDGERIFLRWEFFHNQVVAGFYIHRRAAHDSTYMCLNQKFLVLANASAECTSYAFGDNLSETGVYYYKIETLYLNGRREFSEPITVRFDSNLGLIAPNDFKLDQNYPNPFNSMTIIKLQMPETAKITLQIYNIQGQKVKTLANEIFIAGYHTLQWDATNDFGHRVGSGIFILQMKSARFEKNIKLSLVL
ncbi:cellulase family glycosylhydrolase [candidate division KSB1 bacterium]|nr:cellulase family glycosylhydrolase [candidate division KSB1 bacterium]